MTSETPCLHCAIVQAIETHFDRCGARDPATGKTIYDAGVTVQVLAETTAEIIQKLPNRPQRRSATKFAHDALDAALKAGRVGHPVEVTLEPSGTEH